MSHQRQELEALERLMKEFFEGNIDNQKRQEIEGLLTNFRNRHGCWKLCFEYLEHTKCQYVTMFCLTTIENIINKQWICLPWEEKAEARKLASAYVMKYHMTQSAGVRSKAVKLVVDIARLDWDSRRDFLVDVLNLLLAPDTRHLGLLYLLTISEEWTSPREDLTFDRKNEIKMLLLELMPQVFAMLFEFLTHETVLTNPQDGCLLLKVLTHLFSWVPPSQVPNALISNVFKLASKTENETISVAAIGTLNEMLYRQWVPPQCSQITYHALELSQALLSSPLDRQHPAYLEKFSEFLRLLLGLQFSQSDVKADNIDGLLSAALNFTMRQPTLVPGFSTCLDIWLHLLDNSNSKKYPDVFVSLVSQVLSKIQFRQNGTELSEIEDKTVDDDGETEWKKFLWPCIVIVATVAEMQPLGIIRSVFEQWVELCQMYGGHVLANSVQNVDNLRWLLRDLSTFTQIMGHLQSQCGGENWRDESLFLVARLTVQHLLTLNDLAAAGVPYHSASEDVKTEFHKVHAEVLASLRSWSFWLPRLQTEPSYKPVLDEFVARIVNGCVPFLVPNSPIVLQHCAAHLIATVTSTVRPSRLWELETVKCMFSNSLSHLQEEDRYLVHGALVNCLILKWPTTEDQMWDHRSKLLATYADTLTAPLTSIPLQFSPEYKPAILSVLRLLRYIIYLYKMEGLKTKRLLCVAFQKSIEHTLALFPLYVREPEVNQEILQFFLILLDCLQQQVGVAFTQVSVQTFMDVFTRQQLQVSLAEENGGGLQQLLELLDFVVQTPGLSASKLTPMAVNLCIELFEPVLAESASPCVQESLFQLVYSILVHKWQYFFKYNVDAELRTKEFLYLMKAIGQSFFSSNIDLFKQNLRNVDRLNRKWYLYSKEVFRKELHAQFLTVLLNTLIAKRHSIVKDEVVTVICNLILVDMNAFLGDFLPRFLDSIEPLLPAQKVALRDNFSKDRDWPSVVQNVYRLTNDLICYQLYNACGDERIDLTRYQ